MQQVSRDNNLKIPKKIAADIRMINSINDEVISKKVISIANNEKFDEKKF